MFESYDQKLVVFAFCGNFHELLPTVLGFQGAYMFESYDQKLIFFAFYGRFHDLFPIVLVFQLDLQQP